VNIFLAKISGKRAILDPEESWHCSRVLRKRSGDEIKLIDGTGNFYDGRLEIVSDKACEATVLSGPTPSPQRNYRIHLAIAPTKQMDRIEWLVEKAVEIGVDEISFIICEHSERTTIKTDRIEKIVLSAVKQSLQALLPKVNAGQKFVDFIGNVAEPHKYIAWCGEDEKKEIRDLTFRGRSTLVLIGPEGDFSQQEVNMAHQKGFINLSLGINRLRTETAGLAVVHAASIL
jgi:16S rRNA (uracil1498-N3)-methyltransferase